jgi:hypothetical protein
VGKLDPFKPASIDQANVELLWLLGQPHLSDYLSFMKNKAVGGHKLDPAALTDATLLAAEVATRSGHGPDLLLALTGRRPYPDGLSVV